MKHIIKVISFKRSAGNFIVEVKKNKYCQETIEIPDSEFTAFLDRHNRLTYDGLITFTLEEYLKDEPLDSICGDLADYIICKVVDFDMILQNIFIDIQNIAASC